MWGPTLGFYISTAFAEWAPPVRETSERVKSTSLPREQLVFVLMPFRAKLTLNKWRYSSTVFIEHFSSFRLHQFHVTFLL